MLLFAAAGNDGKNVDGEACFLGFCVESYWHTPCENNGVICLGGLNEGTRTRHPSSNFGSEHVDSYAPFVHFLGPDPENPVIVREGLLAPVTLLPLRQE
ncbi:hypothetical protein SAMN02745866_00875 [Alteromonadaceae bacterium Bs31]|nr:hypothetical protein SAMN02745866_00875 [Alteromonadaceae bacterium Bs31]